MGKGTSTSGPEVCELCLLLHAPLPKPGSGARWIPVGPYTAVVMRPRILAGIIPCWTQGSIHLVSGAVTPEECLADAGLDKGPHSGLGTSAGLETACVRTPSPIHECSNGLPWSLGFLAKLSMLSTGQGAPHLPEWLQIK